MEVCIVGAGAMGRWLAETLDADLAIADVDETRARETAAAVGGRTVPLEPDGDTYDAVCLAVPMGEVEAAIATQAVRVDGAIVDVAGVMEPVLTAMDEYAPAVEHCSLHPLFAPERAPGSIAVVTRSAGPATRAILADLETAENELVETTPAEHDGAMERVQAAAHAAVLAFAAAAEPVPEAFETPLYEGLREQVERIGAGTPRVYADVQDRFDGADAVAEAAGRIAEADHDELVSLIEDATATWVDDRRETSRSSTASGGVPDR
ncbi:prephenate dehydrogenase/arogenate dehydrogenase family protein [Halovivax gelatinilyticus]|uniref:prephenate dehydrogenase/arogenate dehydrogenase family protein n=1 Tax=Halovivax gelatinilyticus TaxID=2961597 RepID=UPI0020CA2ED5|nr:prephenate dehydrogenase/arogenate dehydrogenase family protein [Halovivax gelatinilyticus]